MLFRSIRVITLDTLIPNVTLVSPVNWSYYNNATPLFNITSSETSGGTGSIVPNLDSSLVSWWRMDDLNSSNTGVVDYMGRNNGTPSGGASQVTNGKMGKAMSFDGVDDYVTLSSLPTSGTGNFSVFSWVKTTNTGVRKAIVSYGDGDTNKAYFLYISSSNNVKVDLSNSGGPSSSSTVTDGGWHLVGSVYNGNVMQVYVDGFASGSSQTMTPNITSGS